MDIQTIKQRFGIIGNNVALNRAIDIAMQVACTDISVLVTGESGVGKEFFPKIIHQLSAKKHGPYIAINCGAIPEGTIDSELFGHEKGSFTDARETRKGYFEMADGGTIFLDEVAELPLQTQVRLLRVLETGEFYKVGSSKVQKANVRVVAATNVNIPEAIAKGKFREDLYYRLNTIAIYVPALRERKEDIPLLFRKFAVDISEKYKMPPIQLKPDAVEYLKNYPWKGNVRQLKNVTEQISIIANQRDLSLEELKKYLPEPERQMPVLYHSSTSSFNTENLTEREILYNILFDMRKDITELKRVLASIMQGENIAPKADINQPSHVAVQIDIPSHIENPHPSFYPKDHEDKSIQIADSEVVEESLSIESKERDLIKKALEKHNGNRRLAANELGISERSLYRKIKEYEISTK